MKEDRKVRRTFSTAFKKEKVGLMDKGKISAREISLIYEVSQTAVYKWKKKFSTISGTERVVMEKISEQAKNTELLKRIGELERSVGRKQLELDYYRSAIEVLNEQEGIDVLKKSRPEQ